MKRVKGIVLGLLSGSSGAEIFKYVSPHNSIMRKQPKYKITPIKKALIKKFPF